MFFFILPFRQKMVQIFFCLIFSKDLQWIYHLQQRCTCHKLYFLHYCGTSTKNICHKLYFLLIMIQLCLYCFLEASKLFLRHLFASTFVCRTVLSTSNISWLLVFCLHLPHRSCAITASAVPLRLDHLSHCIPRQLPNQMIFVFTIGSLY